MKTEIFHVNKAGKRQLQVQDLDEAAQLIFETSLKQKLWIDDECGDIWLDDEGGDNGTVQQIFVAETWLGNIVNGWAVSAQTNANLFVQIKARLMMLFDRDLVFGLPGEEELEEERSEAAEFARKWS